MEVSEFSRVNIAFLGADNVTRFAVTNESMEDYLVRILGPKHLPLSVVLPVTIIYVTIFVSGVVGNVAVCVVIARNKSMRTATNYYLFSLAVSDLTLLLLGLPYDLGVYWQQYPWVLGETLCKLRALGSEMSTYTSVLTIVAFSTERYLAICQPIHSYTTSSPRTALRVIAILWCVSLLSATPFAVYTRINYVEYPPGSSYQVAESAFCAMLDQAVPSHWPMYELSALIFFLGPMIIIIILYVRMGVTIRSRMIKFPGETKHLDSRTKPIIRMLGKTRNEEKNFTKRNVIFVRIPLTHIKYADIVSDVKIKTSLIINMVYRYEFNNYVK